MLFELHLILTIIYQVWNGGSAICDVIIAVCMTYYVSPEYQFHNLRLTPLRSSRAMDRIR